MRKVNAKCGAVIPIGRLGENEATVVVFDVAEWIELFGAGTFSLLHQRSGDAAPYPCEIETDGSTVTWIVHSADVAVQGYGKCELIYTVGDTIAKSVIYTTITGTALTGGAEPPEPWEDWVQRVLDAGQRVDDFLATLEGGEDGQVWTKRNGTAQWEDPQGGGGGASSWDDLTDKPFETIGDNLKVVNGALSVDTAPNVEQDNTKPITSAAVYVEVGNINALLALI